MNKDQTDSLNELVHRYTVSLDKVRDLINSRTAEFERKALALTRLCEVLEKLTNELGI